MHQSQAKSKDPNGSKRSLSESSAQVRRRDKKQRFKTSESVTNQVQAESFAESPSSLRRQPAEIEMSRSLSETSTHDHHHDMKQEVKTNESLSSRHRSHSEPSAQVHHHRDKLQIGDTLQKRYEILSTLGEGSFGKVVKVKDIVTDQIIAIKIHRNEESCRADAKLEVDVLKRLADKRASEQ